MGFELKRRHGCYYAITVGLYVCPTVFQSFHNGYCSHTVQPYVTYVSMCPLGRGSNSRATHTSDYFNRTHFRMRYACGGQNVETGATPWADLGEGVRNPPPPEKITKGYRFLEKNLVCIIIDIQLDPSGQILLQGGQRMFGFEMTVTGRFGFLVLVNGLIRSL